MPVNLFHRENGPTSHGRILGNTSLRPTPTAQPPRIRGLPCGTPTLSTAPRESPAALLPVFRVRGPRTPTIMTPSRYLGAPSPTKWWKRRGAAATTLLVWTPCRVQCPSYAIKASRTCHCVARSRRLCVGHIWQIDQGNRFMRKADARTSIPWHGY